MKSDYLRRYTQLPALIYLLSERKLTLLDPSTWDDKNDSYFLECYRQRRNLRSVLALCFTEDKETYHHWSIFAGGSAGVCIEFSRSKLLAAAKKCAGVRARNVAYVPLRAGKKPESRLRVDDLPFCKRLAFQHESEFRLIYQSVKVKCQTYDIPMPLSSISSIYLSPWLPESLVEHVMRTLRGIEGCQFVDIYHSKLISNTRWKRMGDEAIG